MLQLMVLITIIALANGVYGGSHRPFEVHISNTYCCLEDGLMDLFQCQFNLTARNTYSFHNQLVFGKTFKNQLVARIKVDVQHIYSKVPMHVADVRFTVCQRLLEHIKNALLVSFISELYSSSRFVLQCPFKEGQLYNIDNFKVSAASFPQYTPEMNFNVTVEYYDNATLLARQMTMGFIKKIGDRKKGDGK